MNVGENYWVNENITLGIGWDINVKFVIGDWMTEALGQASGKRMSK